MSRPLGARKPRGDLKKTALVTKDDQSAGKQRDEKAALLDRMQERIHGKPTNG